MSWGEKCQEIVRVQKVNCLISEAHERLQDAVVSFTTSRVVANRLGGEKCPVIVMGGKSEHV